MKLYLFHKVRGDIIWSEVENPDQVVCVFAPHDTIYYQTIDALEHDFLSLYKQTRECGFSYSVLHRRSAVISRSEDSYTIVKGCGETTPLTLGWHETIKNHGVFELALARHEAQIARVFHSMGCPTAKPLNLVSLKTFIDKDGCEVCLPKGRNYALYYYKLKSAARFCDLVFFSDSDKRKLVSRSCRHLGIIKFGSMSDQYRQYILCIARLLGITSARLHREGAHNAGIWEHNISLSGEILDFEQAYHPDIGNPHEFYLKNHDTHRRDEILRSINAISYLNSTLKYPVSDRNIITQYICSYLENGGTATEMDFLIHRKSLNCISI